MTSLANDKTKPAPRPAPAAGPADAAWPTAPVSVVILTLNEEINIAECLASCVWCDDVHVLDSGSTDRTREIAEKLGAGVHVNPFESFGAQRNWAIDNIPMKHEWIFHLDADERFTPELVEEMRSSLMTAPEEAGYHVPSKLMFMGRWLRRTGCYPTYQMRLFHKSRMRFTDYGHGQREQTRGVVNRLNEPYLHYNFSKGLEEWFEKHNRYSTREAEEAMRVSCEPLRAALKGLFSRDPVGRRRGLKSITYRAPFRATLVYLYLMLIRIGVFDGPAGWTYARMRSIYEGMISSKVAVMRAERASNLNEGARQ